MSRRVASWTHAPWRLICRSCCSRNWCLRSHDWEWGRMGASRVFSAPTSCGSGDPDFHVHQVSLSSQWAPYNAGYNWQNTTQNLVIHEPITHLNSYKGGPSAPSPSSLPNCAWHWQCRGARTRRVPTDHELPREDESRLLRAWEGMPRCVWLRVRARVCGPTPHCSFGLKLIVPPLCESRFAKDNAYITWINDDKPSWTISAAGMGPDPLTEIGARPVPQEPMVRSEQLSVILSH